MTKETMSVHKALCELKLLDARIEKAIGKTTFVYTNKHSNKSINGRAIESINADLMAAYDSIMDMSKRRNAIKRAVTLSNATTIVHIGDTDMTVAEAIDMKNVGMEYMQELKSVFATQNRNAQDKASKANGNELEMRADNYIATLYGTTEKKNIGEEAAKSRQDFIVAQTIDVVDPLGVTDKIRSLDDSISAFMADVDSALSVSNAITNIDVEY